MGATTFALRALAQRALAATSEAASHERALADQLRQIAPELLAERGVGPVTGAQLIISWSHPGRIRSEAAFARLAGVAPIPASSGQVVRHRLDRGGDRQLNRALHTIVLVRKRSDPATRAYLARRVGEGRSRREATRCLKRYLARHLFRLLEALPVAP
jgi:transposase